MQIFMNKNTGKEKRIPEFYMPSLIYVNYSLNNFMFTKIHLLFVMSQGIYFARTIKKIDRHT
jgi:hypothetical protein